MIRYKDGNKCFTITEVWDVMMEVATSLFQYGLKAVIFAIIAYAGIIGGKKLRDKKDADKAVNSQGR